MKYKSLKLRNKILIGIIPIVTVLLIGSSLNYYNALKESLVERYDEALNTAETRIVDTLNTIDAGYRMLEISLEGDLAEKAKAFEATYNEAKGEISQNLLNRLKSDFGNDYDFMIINDKETIVMSTVPQAINFNFNVFDPVLGAKIKSIRNNDEVWFEQLRTNVGTGKLSKFVYKPTKDHKVLLEVGYSVDGFNHITDELKPHSIIKSMIESSPLIKDIKIFDAYGYQLVDSGENYLPTDDSRALVKRAKKEKNFEMIISDNQFKKYVLVELNSKRQRTLADTDKVIEITYDKSIVSSKLHDLWWRTLFGISTVLVFLLSSIIYLSTRITRPIAVLRDVSEQISKGNYNVRVEIDSEDEVGALGQSFNTMVDEINASFKEIENQKSILEDLNKSLEDKVVQRTQELAFRNEELSIKNSELELAWIKANEATESKSSFLAMISHEIRTPLNGVIGMSYLLLRSKLNHRQSDYIHKIKTSAEGLLEIINDVLDISKLEAGKTHIENIDFSLEEVLELVSNQVGFKAAEKNLELIFATDHDIPTILKGDPLRLRQVLINLLNNAVKFTESGEIFVKTEILETTDKEYTLKFTVKDTGIGIESDKISKLFEPFQQADTSISRRYGGTGLGLSISKRFVELMQGDIWVKSTVGEGSEFIFTAVFQIGEDHLSVKSNEPHDFKSLNVLLVDDSDIVQEVLKDMLAPYFNIIECVTSGEAAIERVEASITGSVRFDVILMDWKMPGIDGIETAYTIKNMAEMQKVPAVLMLTGYDLDEAKDNHKSRYIDAFLSKPIMKSSLLQTIAQFTQESESLSNKKALNVCQIQRILETESEIKILVVDDNVINQQIVSELIEHPLIEVKCVNNGLLAVEEVKESIFDLVIMDIQMPEMDGYEATRRIRMMKGRESVPVIAMTAHAFLEEKEKCILAGMNDFLSKPIEDKKLFEVIVKWIKKPIKVVENKIELEVDDHQWIKVLKSFKTRVPVSNLHGDWHSYFKMLKEFMMQYREISSDLKKIIASSNYASGKELLHALRGTAGNLGAMDLFIAAQSLETDFVKGSVTLTSESFISFLEELNRVRLEIEEAIALVKPYEQEAYIDRNLLEMGIKDFLEELKDHLVKGSSDAMMYIPIIGKILTNEYTQNEIQLLIKHIENYDFDEALNVLESHNMLL